MLFLQSKCGKLRLSPDAVEDVATLLTYYRLAFSITSKAQRSIATDNPKCNAAAIALHYEKMDAALAFVASNLQQEYDVFKMTIAHQEVVKRIGDNRSKRARSLSPSPTELANVLANIIAGPDSGDSARDSVIPPGQPVAPESTPDNAASSGKGEEAGKRRNARRHRAR